MHWILVYNALFFFDFLFNRIVPNLYISNAGVDTNSAYPSATQLSVGLNIRFK